MQQALARSVHAKEAATAAMRGQTHADVRCEDERLLHTYAFSHRHFYTQTLFTQRSFYTQTLLHRDAFTHKRFYRDSFTRKSFYTEQHAQKLLNFTQRSLYKKQLFTAVFDIDPHFVRKGCRRG